MLPTTLLKAADPAMRANPAPTVTISSSVGWLTCLSKQGGNLCTGGVDRTVEGCSGHIKGPGDDTVGCTTGQPEQEDQAGDLRIPAVVCVAPHGFHKGIK